MIVIYIEYFLYEEWIDELCILSDLPYFYGKAIK